MWCYPVFGLSVASEEHLRWYHSSEKVRLCAFDGPTNTKLAQHIFTAEKGDYYDITDGLPQNEH